MIELHCFGESGHSYKAALGLTLAGLAWTPVRIDFFSGETRGRDFRQGLNPMGEAPVLVDGDTRLTQSGVILDWIARRTGAFADLSDPDVLRWVLWDNHKLSGIAGTARFMANYLAPEKRSGDVSAFLEGRLRAALNVLEGHLEGRDWIAGDALSPADLSCCSYLYYPEPFGFARLDWPAIDSWLSRIEGHPSWGHPYDLMPRAWPAGAER